MIPALLLAAAVLSANAAEPAGSVPAGSVDVHFQGLRSAKGMIRACLTREPRFFPHCDKDPASFKQSVAATSTATLHFAGVAPGEYALTVLHDENGNFKADTTLGIPREGFGFSRNPVIRFGPPAFADARFAVRAGDNVQQITMKYMM